MIVNESVTNNKKNKPNTIGNRLIVKSIFRLFLHIGEGLSYSQVQVLDTQSINDQRQSFKKDYLLFRVSNRETV